MRLIWPLVLVLALVSHGYAASLAHVYEPVQMPNGEAVPGASVYVYLPNTELEVTIYEDAAGTSPITQPETTTSGGMMSFYVAPGTYDIYIVYSPWSVATTWEDYNAVYDPGGKAISPIIIGSFTTSSVDVTLFGVLIPRAGYMIGASGAFNVGSVTGTVPVVVSIRKNGDAVLADTTSVTATGVHYWSATPSASVAFAASDTLDGYIDVTGTISLSRPTTMVEMQYDR
jgi:hypothetical protein